MNSKVLPLAVACAALVPLPIIAAAGNEGAVATGQAAFQDYKSIKAGQFRKITAADLPAPYASESANNNARVVPRPADAWPQAPGGFKVELYATELGNPRELRTAPNGDIFLAETARGEIKIFRGISADGKPVETSAFATGLNRPFGIAFYPPGPNPSWVYVGNINSVVSIPYKNGDLKAAAAPETMTTEIPGGGGHTTRDLAFSPDGKRLFVAVGSASNVDDPDTHPSETHRANILEFPPEGKFVKV